MHRTGILDSFHIHLILFLITALILFTFPVSAQNVSIPSDASEMFNERGFLKSNSVSFDEGELINNLNSYLNYTFLMYRMHGQNDIYIDLTLNYNGSVKYQAVTANKSFVGLTKLPRFNFSAPGWIIMEGN